MVRQLLDVVRVWEQSQNIREPQTVANEKLDVATVATSQRPAPPVRGTVIGSAAAAMLVAPAKIADTPRHRIGPHVRMNYFTAMKEDDQPTCYGRKE